MSSLKHTWVVAIALGVAGPAAAKEAPAARTEGLVEALIAVKSSPEEGDLSDADRAANRKTFARLDDFFDFDSMVAEAIRPHRAKLDAKQMLRYQSAFKALIRLVAYPDSGSFLQGAERKVKKTKVKGKTATVDMSVAVPDDDLEFEVTFHWANTGTWRLVDVAFDGAKLTKDYQNQFGRLIGKVGVDGLIGKLEKRLAKEQKASPL